MFPDYSACMLFFYREVLPTKLSQGKQCTQSSTMTLAFYIAPVKGVYVCMYAAPARVKHIKDFLGIMCRYAWNY